MFKDQKEELQRLEQALLAEEDTVEEQEEELPSLEDTLRWEDTRPADGPVVYQNFSNDYGAELRNYASGYKAYNTDKTDNDLDSYSETVRQGNKSTAALVVLAGVLAAGIIAVTVYLLLRFGGHIG